MYLNKLFLDKNINLESQKEIREILDKYKVRLEYPRDICLSISTGESVWAGVIDYLPLYCKVYDINNEILNKIDPYGYEILEKEEILKLIELFTFVLDDSKKDIEKEIILDKVLGIIGYSRDFFINKAKEIKTLCEKAIRENKNIIQTGS